MTMVRLIEPMEESALDLVEGGPEIVGQGSEAVMTCWTARTWIVP